MDSPTSFNFEIATYLNDSQSSACKFFGISNGGTLATIISNDGTAYSYQLQVPMVLEDFNAVVSASVGSFWVKVLKIFPHFDKTPNALDVWEVTADIWHQPFNNAKDDFAHSWQINSESPFAF